MMTVTCGFQWMDCRRVWHRWVLAGLALLTGAFLLGSAPAPAGTGDVIGADEAMARTAAGKVLLIDVRSPQEWQQTGVPKGARLVTIHNAAGLAGFVTAVKLEIGGGLDTPIAVICARGNRSTLAQQALAGAGFTNILNIREGMLGSPSGPGWLARGLPVEDCSRC